MIFIGIAVALAATVYALRHGRGKGRLWALAPLAVYVSMGVIELIVFSAAYGIHRLGAAVSSPLARGIGIVETVGLIVSGLWTIYRVRLRRASWEAENL